MRLLKLVLRIKEVFYSDLIIHVANAPKKNMASKFSDFLTGLMLN